MLQGYQQHFYNIRVGRSVLVTGPYLDKDGKDLLQAGGTSFLETKGRFIGPGRAGIYWEAGHSWVNEWPVVVDEGEK